MQPLRYYNDANMVSMTIRLEDDLHEWLREFSKTQNRSIQKQIIHILTEAKGAEKIKHEENSARFLVGKK